MSAGQLVGGVIGAAIGYFVPGVTLLQAAVIGPALGKPLDAPDFEAVTIKNGDSNEHS